MSDQTTSPTARVFEDKRYIHSPGILSKDLAHVAAQYALFESFSNHRPEPADGQVPGTHAKYADPLMESILAFLRPRIELITGLELLPSYSYYRLYRPGDELKRHKDRPCCEISTTICLGYRYRGMHSDYSWAIRVGSSDGSTDTAGEAFACGEGDAVVYRGCEIEHWREPFDVPTGSWHAQAFLHYVDADGPYADFCKFDGRPSLGVSHTTKDPTKVAAAAAADRNA